MKIGSIGDNIATRRLCLAGKELTVSIGSPVPFPDDRDYYCPYSIQFDGRTTVRYAGGVDAIQALQLVMGMIGADVSALARELGAEVTWLDETGSGFPAP